MAHAVRYQADQNPPFCSFAVKSAFNQLERKEQLYAHYISEASWAGARIIQGQWTPQAMDLYDLFLLVFSNPDRSPVDFEKLKTDSGVSDEQWKQATTYVAQVFGNLVNYKSFGFTKFIPRIHQDDFKSIVAASPNSQVALDQWNKLVDHIYSVEPESAMLIGDPSKGHVTNYYFGEEIITSEEVSNIQTKAEALKIDVLNTRIEKHGPNTYTLHVASVDEREQEETLEIAGSTEKGSLKIKYGDFKDALQKSIDALRKAREYAANDHQKSAIDKYIESFQTGDIQAHKDGSTHWVRDVGPVVESYIGFVETYVDPVSAARAEWEGFCAIVDKALSAKYEKLLDRASELIKDLPWGPDFEVDTFRKPDFTALQVLSFATGGIPAGINIPNYYEIRENVGFKNVSLANILAAKAPDEEVTFIEEADLQLYNKWESKAFELQVANHELLGHGSGKLFTQDKDGNLNFDKDKVINPLTNKHIESWYLPGQTSSSVLGTVSSSMEECRAEAVALYLVSNKNILSIFNYTEPEDIDEIQYITFLLMCRAGLRALEFYDPKAKKHLQAHMQARMGITNHLIEHGIARIEREQDNNGVLKRAYVKVDRDLVLSKGREVMGELLVKLQVYKSTADAKGAKRFYEALTTPRVDWDEELRQLVLFKKLPRKLFVQPNTFIEKITEGDNQGERVVMREYELNEEGMIRSHIDKKLGRSNLAASAPSV